jgi:hypothetical protein
MEAHMANPDTFDPRAWLSAFEAVGGGWIVRDTLSLAIAVEGRTDDELIEARRLVSILSSENRRALITHLTRRTLREATDA